MISSKPSSAPLEVRVDGSCGTLVLQRPTRCNALSRELVALLQEALRDLHQLGSLRGVILIGAGTMFSAGSDLHEIQGSLQGSEAERHWFQDANALRELFLAMLRYPRPIVAAVNGPALGSGFGLVLACDLVLAAPDATFGTPESLRGLTAGVSSRSWV